MGEETDRPATAGGKSHKRGGRPSAATATLLARYQASMRAELSGILDELEPRMPDAGLGLDPDPQPVKLPVKDRVIRWDLAIKIGRELGTEVDPAGDPGATPALPATRRRRRGRIDFG